MRCVGRAKRMASPAHVVVQLRLAGREAAVDARRAPDQPARRDRAAEDVKVAALARAEVRRPEAQRDAVDRPGEEEGELAERHRIAVGLDVGLDRLEDGARDVRAEQRRDDEPREQLAAGNGPCFSSA